MTGTMGGRNNEAIGWDQEMELCGFITHLTVLGEKIFADCQEYVETMTKWLQKCLKTTTTTTK